MTGLWRPAEDMARRVWCRPEVHRQAYGTGHDEEQAQEASAELTGPEHVLDARCAWGMPHDAWCPARHEDSVKNAGRLLLDRALTTRCPHRRRLRWVTGRSAWASRLEAAAQGAP